MKLNFVQHHDSSKNIMCFHSSKPVTKTTMIIFFLQCVKTSCPTATVLSETPPSVTRTSGDSTGNTAPRPAIFVTSQVSREGDVHLKMYCICTLNTRFRYKRGNPRGLHTFSCHSAIVESKSHFLWSEHLRYYASLISYLLLTA